MFWYERRAERSRRRFRHQVSEAVRFVTTEALAGIGVFALIFAAFPFLLASFA